MDTRRLTLLRHGQAQPMDSCPEDFERTLTRHGTVEVEEMAKRLVRRGLLPDLILVSPAERTWTTAAIVAAACELDSKQIQGARELYLATPQTIWRVLKAFTGSTAARMGAAGGGAARMGTAGRGVPGNAALGHVLICGHNPGLSQLASHLGPKPAARELATAGLASAVWHADSWSSLEPETASACDFDDPDTMTDLWV